MGISINQPSSLPFAPLISCSRKKQTVGVMVTLVTSRHISVSPITAHTLLRSFPDFVSLFLSYLLFALPSFFFFCLAPCCSFYFVPAER